MSMLNVRHVIVPNTADFINHCRGGEESPRSPSDVTL